ncbi:MAG TPA: CBS domain-containing protein [Polyangiaceae bacterium]|nr:CBS domain-containing protein [Polyangiaceae bacterium]
MTSSPKLVRDLMTLDVVTIGRNDKLQVADDVMRLGRIRHLPVVDDDGTLAGVVSQRDLFHSGLIRALGYGTHAQRNALDMVVVKEAMRTEVQTIGPDAPLAEAAQRMLEGKIGCLVVVDGGKLAGIITEADFVKLYAST